MKKLSMAALAASVAGLGLAVAAGAAPAPAYRLVKAVPLGAPDRWDYVVVDSASDRVYIAHSDQLAIVDGKRGVLLGTVRGIAGGTHGTAISHATGTGYTDDGKAGEAVAFDLKTFKIKAHIKAAADADAMAFDPVTGHVFVVEGDPATLSVINPHTNKVVATIAGGGKLESGAADGKGHVYVNGEEKRELIRIDARSNKVDARYPIADCESPHGLAVDEKNDRVFVSCVNEKMVVVNGRTGAIVATVPIGKGSDSAAYDPSHHRAFSSNGRDGTLSVIQQEGPDKYVALEPIATKVTGRTMGVDPKTGRVFIAAADVDPTPGPNGRPRAKPGSLKLLILDPVR
ncbi:MAG TPA: YncE family protein [Caulobacteraceae bacterium]|jgi:YVTN family beta-propeller protein|nr:YncE family protein [Caulobacteraceae bacterium]